MQSLKRRLSFRKKKDHVPECSKPHQWQEDEKKVRDATCSFQVRYLGCTEVFDSRGMQVCEDAVKALKAGKGKYQRAVLYVSGDALRVVDEISKSMIVDQTIEKVSFCAPDRNHEKGFAYICRDGTTRRWMCHGFMAVKESVSGERLSHAVGCAFAICLEKKQKRDKETGVTVTYSQDRTSFTRTGSFRQTTLTERIVDPQSAIIASEPVPVRKTDNPFAVQRPHASANALHRQGSFRGFEKLQEASSPFKRTLSLRLNDLPSTLQRQNAVLESPSQNGNGAVGETIQEVSPEHEDSISQMCQQLTMGLSAMSSHDPFAASPAPAGAPGPPLRQGPQPTLQHQASAPSSAFPPAASHSMLQRQHTLPASHTTAVPGGSNPWAMSERRVPDPHPPAGPSSNPFTPLHNGAAPAPQFPAHPTHQQQRLAAFAHGRSHSMDSGELSLSRGTASHKPTLLNLTQAGGAPSNPNLRNGSAVSSSSWATQSSVQSASSSSGGVDPFDVAWAAKAVGGRPPNTGSAGGAAQASAGQYRGSRQVKQFEVQL